MILATPSLLHIPFAPSFIYAIPKLHISSSSLDSPVDAGSQCLAQRFSRTSQSDHLLLATEDRKNHQSLSQLAT
eukprot:4651149-Pleurochrysis_carterae.AAC.1